MRFQVFITLACQLQHGFPFVEQTFGWEILGGAPLDASFGDLVVFSVSFPPSSKISKNEVKYGLELNYQGLQSYAPANELPPGQNRKRRNAGLKTVSLAILLLFSLSLRLQDRTGMRHQE